MSGSKEKQERNQKTTPSPTYIGKLNTAEESYENRRN
jgi:hypothetical protein